MCADLADNRPGDSARRKADELKAASPGRAFVARLLNVHTDERAYRKGSKGEEEVGRRLKALGENWRVLHAVQVSETGTDIDHVVIGPPGVFTLNTKNHLNGNVWVAENVFMVNGKKYPYLRNSRSEGARASKLLSKACGFEVKAQPVIVVMANNLTFKAYPKEVDVVRRKQIAQWLEARPAALGVAQISSIFEMARLSSTWLPEVGRSEIPTTPNSLGRSVEDNDQ